MIYSPLFLKCLNVVLKNEGGLSNNPLDPGHATNKGITQAVYDIYRARKGESFQSVSLLTVEECDDIYLTLYWLPMKLTLLNDDDLILHVFDHGVNAGIRTSIKMLQRLVKTTDDGFIGEQTINAVSTFEGDILEEFIKRRKLFYVTLAQNRPSLRVFLKGWLKRIENCKFT
jgi:lysozyme family protein